MIDTILAALLAAGVLAAALGTIGLFIAVNLLRCP